MNAALRMIKIAGALLAFGSLAACSSLKGGLIGAVQEADDKLAAANGLPPEVLDALRSQFRIKDTRVDPFAGYKLETEYFKDGLPYDLRSALNGVTVVSSWRRVQVLDVDSLLSEPLSAPEASAPVPEPEATPQTNASPPVATVERPTLHSVSWAGFPMIKFTYSGIGTYEPNGDVIGMIKVNHKKVEFFHPGQTVQSLKNINGAEYFQDIAHGQTVEISIADVKGKQESNTRSLVWP